MFERFTDQARRSVVLAQEECRRLGHGQIDPEHVLLGVLMQPDTAGCRVLVRLGADPGALRREVEEAVGQGSRSWERGGHVPFNPLTKHVLETSLRESLRLRHNYLGTEHLLLALIGAEGPGARALRAAGVELDRTRELVAHLPPVEAGQPPRPGADPVEDEPILRAVRAAKDAALDRGDLEAAAALRADERALLEALRRKESGEPEAG
jgi:ATP-dependent Clp protease ATP-binding subunit ClpA